MTRPSSVRHRWRRLVHRSRRAQGKGPAAPHPKVRMQVVGVVVLALFAVMVVRLWSLQVLHATRYSSKVAAQADRVNQLPAARGLIVDRRGTALVDNVDQWQITVSRVDATIHPQVLSILAELAGVSLPTIEKRLNNPQFTPTQQVPVVPNATEAQLAMLLQHRSLFPGVHHQAVTVRSYPYGTTASHLLGYVTPITAAELKAHKNQGYLPGDSYGQSGVEAQYQRYLRGTPGRQIVEVNATGTPVRVLATTPPTSGDTVMLHLDLSLQQALDHDLAAEIAKLRKSGVPAPSGAAVVMNPNDGAVLAMASYPTYNPSVWTGGISEANYLALTSPQSHDPLLNRAIAGLYTPGSTFKLATATAALQDGLITTQYTYNDATGTYTIPGCTGGGCTFHNAGYEALGVINITPAIAASDDAFFYNLGVQFWLQRAKYGLDAIQKWANAYSFGTGTGIDLPGEQTGFVDSPQVEQKLHQLNPKAYPYPQWYAGNNLEMAFGQGATLLTPIELADAYSTFANGGTRYKPEVAAAIVSPTGQLVKKIAPVVTGHVVLSPQNRAAMLAGFEGAVASPIGTAYYTFKGFPLNQLQVAGKTGTASVRGPQGQRLQPDSLFVGFAPATSPKWVVAGVISNAGYGAAGFAYVAKAIFTYLMSHPVPALSLPKPAASLTRSGSPGAGHSAATATRALHRSTARSGATTATPRS